MASEEGGADAEGRPVADVQLFQEDVVQSVTNPGRIGVVTRVGGDSDSDSESSSDDNDEDDEDREREPPLAEGCARIVWLDSHESVEKATDIQVLDRAFMHGDVVALASDPLGQTGTVVEVDMQVDLELNEKEIARGLDSRRLRRVRALAPGDNVIHGHCLGRLKEVTDNVTVMFDDGSKCKVQHAHPDRLVPCTENLMGDADSPYYPGQRVRAASSGVFKNTKWLRGFWKANGMEGTVVEVEAGMVIVHWIAVSVLHPSTVPSEEQDPKDLVPMRLFGHTSWRIGDRALLPQGFKVAADELGGVPGATSEAGVLDESNGDPPLPEGASGSAVENASGPIPSADAAVDEVADEAANGVTAPKQRKISKLRKVTRKESRATGNAKHVEKAALVVNTRTSVDILWQDGTKSSKVDSRSLVPVKHLGDHDFWPEQYVLEQGPDGDDLGDEVRRIGVLKSFDAKQRTAVVRWLKPVSRPEDLREFGEEETVSVYEIVGHPDYAHCLGDVVIHLSPASCDVSDLQTESSEASSAEDAEEHDVDVTEREHTKVQTRKKKTTDDCLSNTRDLSWVGIIIGLQDGDIEVHWANGIVSKVGPQAVFVVTREDDDMSSAHTSDLEDEDENDDDNAASSTTISRPRPFHSSLDPAPEGTPLLSMSEATPPLIWTYGECGRPGGLRLLSVEKLLNNSNERSIDLYEWPLESLSWQPRRRGPRTRTPGMPAYAAISHTWGQSPDVERRSKEANRPLLVETSLPKPHVISWLGLVQAATAARELKCEYLWLDLLCLNQLSKVDKKAQIGNMHNIYANAMAVVVMFGGVSAAQGLDQVSSWINRAWTLQEGTLCYETWGLVEWTQKGSFFMQNGKLVFEKLDGGVGIVRVAELLEYKPGERLGDGFGYMKKEKGETVPVKFDLEVACLGRDPVATSALAAAIPAIRLDVEGSVVSPESLVSPGVLAMFEKAIADTFRELKHTDMRNGDLVRMYDAKSQRRRDHYDHEKEYPEIRHSTAWRSMWLRTSTKEQDMVFSTMHLFGATIEVDYERTLESLVFELVEKTSSIPAWLGIGYDIPVMPTSGLIPMLPTFTAQSEPSYKIDGITRPAASMVCADFRCYNFDMEVKSTDIRDGHLICARMFDVKQAIAPVKWLKDSSFDWQSDVQLSNPGFELSTSCRFKGRMGSMVVIVGERLTNKTLLGWDSDLEPFIYLLGQNDRGVWQKTGAGTLAEPLFWHTEDLDSVEWRHLRVGGGPGAKILPCDCGKGALTATVAMRELRFNILEAYYEELREVCSESSQELLDMALRETCCKGSQRKIEVLIDTGANVNAEGGFYGTALQAACFDGKDRIVELLIRRGADIHARGGEYGNALQAACYSGNHRIVRMLLEMGVDVNARGGFYDNALQAAARWDRVDAAQLLLDHGADVNAQGGPDGDALTAAASCVLKDMVRLLIQNGANVNSRGGKSGSPLMAAASHDSLEVVQMLVENGADVNAKGYRETSGGRYVVNALQESCRSHDANVARFLLNRGADVNAMGGSYGTALGVAAHYANVVACKLLIAHGADVNSKGGYWGTALQAAAPHTYGQNEDVMLVLIKYGADVNVRGGPYGNALQAAASDGKEKAVRVMIEHGADVNAYGGKYGTALQAAAQATDGNICRLLIEAGASPKVEDAYIDALRKALADGYEGMVRRLIDEGGNVNATGGRYGTVLQAASCNDFREVVVLLSAKVDGRSPLKFKAVSPEEQHVVVRLLVEKGAGVNVQGGYYGTSLQAASYNGNSLVVRQLVTNGAQVNVQGGYYGNALQAAGSCGHEGIVSMLIDARADVNAESGHYGTALQAAARHGHQRIVERLIQAGAKVNAGVDWQGRSAIGKYGNALLAAAHHGKDIVELLLQKGGSVEGVDNQGRTALHIAAAQGNYELVGRLLPLIHTGPGRFSRDGQGRNILHHAAASGSVREVERILALPAIKPDAVDSDGWTALHWAARKGTKSVVKRLIEAGIGTSAKSAHGMTALQVAIFHRNVSLVSLLYAPSTSTGGPLVSEMQRLKLATPIAVGAVGDREEPIVGLRHHGIFCDGCQFALFGPRYQCRKCEDFDYCFKCIPRAGETHPHQEFKCVGKPMSEIFSI